MKTYRVIKKVVSEYELEVEAENPTEAFRKVYDNEEEGGDLVDDYYLEPDTWVVEEVVEKADG